MKIGLVRHFKVLKDYPYVVKIVSQSQVLEWFNEYDRADVEESFTHLGGIDWDVCYASDLKRAIKTANSIYKGNIIEKEELREFKLQPILKETFIFRLLYGRCSYVLPGISTINRNCSIKLNHLKK